MFRNFATFIAVLSFGSIDNAQFGYSAGGGGTSSTATLVSENAAIAPGKPFTVALQLSHPANWHSYYKNSGGVEMSPEIAWTLPAGFTAGPIQWPTPEIKSTDLGKSLIYSGSPTFLVEITPPATATPGQTATLSAHATWQICEVTCVNESKDFTLELPIAAEAAPDSTQTTTFAEARKSLPVPKPDWKFTARNEGANIALTIAGPGLNEFQFDFIPDQPFLDAVESGNSLTISIPKRTEDIIGDPIPEGPTFSGILASKTPGIPSVIIADTPIIGPAGSAPAAVAADKPADTSKSYFFIFGGMFLGGLILNLMPCVFPVIGIKIMGFVQQAGHERKKIVLHGLIFALGVLLSFWALATALFLGGITNWGNQLQDPRVSFITIVIMLLLGMNLYGVFEIGTAATGVGGNLVRKQGIAGTFFSGILATLVATPCSGPFLGVAIGAAAVLPAVPFFAAFTCMALGLALPYLVLSAFPKLVDRLPRPGAWMESFKQGMSFLLFATAGYFLWVYSAQVFEHNEGQKGLWVMLGISAIACAAWIYGRWNQPYRSGGVRLVAKICAIGFITTGIALAWPWAPPIEVAGQENLKVDWQPWSQAEVDRLLAAGQPVYIDFTAKWCLTCQLNKKRAYTPEVVKLMQEKRIVALKADKTNPNPAIEAKLKELGRTAIPVNVLLVPGNPNPIITPELLSPGDLTKLFTEIP